MADRVFLVWMLWCANENEIIEQEKVERSFDAFQRPDADLLTARVDLDDWAVLDEHRLTVDEHDQPVDPPFQLEKTVEVRR